MRLISLALSYDLHRGSTHIKLVPPQTQRSQIELLLIDVPTYLAILVHLIIYSCKIFQLNRINNNYYCIFLLPGNSTNSTYE